jgi:hypothetical protein
MKELRIFVKVNPIVSLLQTAADIHASLSG